MGNKTDSDFKVQPVIIRLTLAFGLTFLLTFLVSYIVNLVDPARPIPGVVQNGVMLAAGCFFGILTLMVRRNREAGGDEDERPRKR